MSGGLGSPPHGHAPLPDPRTPTAQPQDAQIRAAYGNFLRGVRRDIVRPFLMGAAAAFGMSLGYRLWDLCAFGSRTLLLLMPLRLRGSAGSGAA